MVDTKDPAFQNFDSTLTEFKEATSLTRQDKAQKMASQIDLLVRKRAGIEYLSDLCLELESLGIFEGTPWNEPQKQVPNLVKGTLLSGHPNSSFEILSELRILAYAEGRAQSQSLSAEDAQSFLEEVLVLNLEFAFDELSEETRNKITQQERRKIVQHFGFLLDRVELSGIKEKLAEEMRMVIAQRPIVTNAVRSLIQTVYHKIELDESRPEDQDLLYFVRAIYFPGGLVEQNTAFAAYQNTISTLDEDGLRQEAQQLGKYLHETSLTNPYLAMMLRHISESYPELMPELLQLDDQGISEWNSYQDYLRPLIADVFSQDNYRGIYGLKRMLERNLFAREAVRSGLSNLKLIRIHPETEKRVLKSVNDPSDNVSAVQYLTAATLSILGQPLGIGQGNNATCQSARGISMWAEHAPAKLINMVTTVAAANNLIIRFENQDLESLLMAQGLIDKLDHKLDAVSVVLVSHLDKIYNEMMRRAAGRGEDPHKWANPALYGQWIEDGFASAYSYLSNSVQDYNGFVKLFYAGFHPSYNGGREMVYPNPVGIFITSSRGDMLGFHAVSLLRVDFTEGEEAPRAYFLNPNNEGRQNWGQGIQPSVYGRGERPGESSLPIHEFTARLYAFHFNTLNAKSHLQEVPTQEVQRVRELAENSWGRQYTWLDIEKVW